MDAYGTLSSGFVEILPAGEGLFSEDEIKDSAIS